MFANKHKKTAKSVFFGFDVGREENACPTTVNGELPVGHSGVWPRSLPMECELGEKLGDGWVERDEAQLGG